MPNAFLAGFPLGLQEGIGFNNDQAYRQALLAMSQAQMADRRRQALQQQQLQALLGANMNLFAAPQMPQPDQTPQPPQQDQIQRQPLTPPLPQVPQATAQMRSPLGLIAQDESGGRNIPNYRFDPTHTASGPWQITDSTWNRYAPAVGAPKLSYPASPMDRPIPEQEKVADRIYQSEGAAPWANFNPKLAADLKASVSPEIRESSSPIAIRAAGAIPPQMVGQVGPGPIAQLIQRIAGSDAPNEVKGAAMIELLPLMSQEAQRQFTQQWEQVKFAAGQGERAREFDIREGETKAQHEFNRQMAERGKGADWQIERTPDGQLITVNKITGESKPVDAPKGTGRVGQAVSPEDLKPGGDVETIAKAVAEYRMAPLSSWVLRSDWGKRVMADVMRLNPNYNAPEYAGRTSGARAFASGRQADTVRSMNVVTDHITVLSELIDGLQNRDFRPSNKLINAVKTEFGWTGALNFDAAKVIVGDEIAKAVIGGQNAERDRAALQDKLASANTPQQLKEVTTTFERLIAGQLGGLRRQFEWATGEPSERFDQMLSPAAKDAIGRYETGREGGGDGQPTLRYDPADGRLKPIGSQ